MTGRKTVPIAFIDRDGVINAYPGHFKYVTSLAEFRLLPNAAEGIKQLAAGGFRIFVVSNQAGVAKGLYSQQTLDEITRVMREGLAAQGAKVDAVYYCTHRSDAGCGCRKPAQGMLEQAYKVLESEGLSPDFSRSVFIGDSMIDLETGTAAGITTILVFSGRETPENSARWSVKPDATAPDLAAAARRACATRHVPISAVVVARNEEKMIGDCLKSVHGRVDELILVDNGSTDRTVEIGKKYCDTVLEHSLAHEGLRRNWAAAQAKNDWVLMFDADERMTPALLKEIYAALAKDDGTVAAYWAPQRTYIGGRLLKYGGWDAPRCKLYNRRLFRWKEDPSEIVHVGIDVTPGYAGGKLTTPFEHYSFRDFEHLLAKSIQWSSLEAEKWHRQGRNMTLFHGLWRMADRFFRRYVRKQGYRDGFYGFTAAFIMGLYQFFFCIRMREIREKAKKAK